MARLNEAPLRLSCRALCLGADAQQGGHVAEAGRKSREAGWRGGYGIAGRRRETRRSGLRKSRKGGVSRRAWKGGRAVCGRNDAVGPAPPAAMRGREPAGLPGLTANPSRLGWQGAGERIGMATVTRAGLARAVHRETGLPQSEAAALVETVIETIAERLSAGEAVGISGFGSFGVRDKGPRQGRNPRTGEPAAIPALRVVTFRPSAVLKQRIAEKMDGAGDGE